MSGDPADVPVSPQQRARPQVEHLLDGPVHLTATRRGWWVEPVDDPGRVNGEHTGPLLVEASSGLLLAFPPDLGREQVSRRYRVVRRRAIVLGAVGLDDGGP